MEFTIALAVATGDGGHQIFEFKGKDTGVVHVFWCVEMKKTALFLAGMIMIMSVLCACTDPSLSVGSTSGSVTPTPSEPTSSIASSLTPNQTSISMPTLTPTPTPTPTPSESKTEVAATFSMLAVGDNLLHRSILYDGMEHASESERFNFDHIYKNVKDAISSADYAMINQESIIIGDSHVSKDTTRYYRYFFEGMFNTGNQCFLSPEAALDTLKNVGFDGIGIGNNHVLDGGAAGMQWGIDLIKKTDGLDCIGGYYNEADRSNIPVVEHDGIKVALLGYTYDTNVSSENAAREEGFKFLVPYINDEEILKDLELAEEVADFTVVFIHWGDEIASSKQIAAGMKRTFEPNDEQKRVAKLLAENGAGIIIGHHSHALQNIEYIPDGKGGEVLCAYSLGTFVSNMVDEWNHLAGLFSFDIVKWDDGRITVENAVLTPTVCWYDKDHRNYTVYYLKDLTPALAETSGVSSGMSVDHLYSFLHEAVRDEFLPEEYRTKQ